MSWSELCKQRVMHTWLGLSAVNQLYMHASVSQSEGASDCQLSTMRLGLPSMHEPWESVATTCTQRGATDMRGNQHFQHRAQLVMLQSAM